MYGQFLQSLAFSLPLTTLRREPTPKHSDIKAYRGIKVNLNTL